MKHNLRISLLLKPNKVIKYLLPLFAIAIIGFAQTAFAQEGDQASAQDLAKKLANPIASLISLPFQNSTDIGIGINKGSRYTLNIQPVIPVSVSENLNLITRIILPVISQSNITGIGNNETGLGDVVLSAFLSPSNSKKGLTWGAGPVFLIPAGTDDFLTSKKFGIGPTAVALYQSKGFTVGALFNQIWSVAGSDSRSEVSSLFFQPFFNYNWKSGAGIGGSFEIAQNWQADNTNIWFNPSISGVTGLGKQKVQLAIGPRFNLVAPDGGKADFGFRGTMVFLFPK